MSSNSIPVSICHIGLCNIVLTLIIMDHLQMQDCLTQMLLLLLQEVVDFQLEDVKEENHFFTKQILIILMMHDLALELLQRLLVEFQVLCLEIQVLYQQMNKRLLRLLQGKFINFYKQIIIIYPLS